MAFFIIVFPHTSAAKEALETNSLRGFLRAALNPFDAGRLPELAKSRVRPFPVCMQPVWISILLVTSCLLTSCANYNKEDPFMITLHLEGSSIEGESMVFPEHVGYPPKIRYFRITPEFTHRQVEAFYPFRAEDGNSNGAVLVLGSVGQRRLFSTTSTNEGKILLVKVDGRTADYLMIDRAVRDGIIMILQGISDPMLDLFEDKDVGWIKLPEPPFGPPEAETQEDLFDPLLR